MNLQEYENVKKLTYLEYCDYLQEKYGIGLSDYMGISKKGVWYKKKCSRTKEGLIAHHKYEDHAIQLCNPEFAKKHPFEWQLAKNLVYCDYLEHLFLHILICENQPKDSNESEVLGQGGVCAYLVPELNDVYSGFKSSDEWRINCHQRIINDKSMYLTLLERFKPTYRTYGHGTEVSLLSSFNDRDWSRDYNKAIFEEIKQL